jgi:hypothetical protein
MLDLKARAKRILQFFNLTIPEWDRISAYQNNRCAICGRPPLPGKNLSTDHCHKTGLVRGLLCNLCNRLLGKIERQWGPDAVKSILAAIKYLQEPPASKALGRQVFTFAGQLGTKRHRKALKKAKKSCPDPGI